MIEQMLPNRIGVILSFFDALGFNSGSSKLFHSKKPINFIRFVHIVLFALLTLSLMIVFFQLLSSYGLIEAINESVECIASLFTYYLIVMDANLQQGAHKHFWTILQEIDKKICGQSNCKFRSTIAKIVELFSITFILIAITSISSEMFQFIGFLVYTSSIIICQTRLLYYLFCLEAIEFQMEKIVQEFEAMKNILHVENCGIRSLNSFELQRFKRTRSYFHCIYKMVNALQEFFGWSHVAAIPFTFFCLFTDLNFFYIHKHEMPGGLILGRYFYQLYTFIR